VTKKINFENIYEYNFNQTDTNCMSLYFPKDIANGKMEIYNLNNGLNLYNLDFKANDNFIMENRFDKKVISFTSFFRGKMKFENQECNINKIFNENILFMNTFNCEDGLSYYNKGDRVNVLSISVDEEFLENIFCNKNNEIIDTTITALTDTSFSTIYELEPNITTLIELNKLISTDLNKNFKKLYLQSKVYEFLYENFNLMEQKTETFLPQIEQKYLLKVKEYIENNLYKELSIKELAKISSSNETKFQKNFKIYFKTTVYKYILDCRMRKAKELLTSNDLSISEITSMVGYKHQSNFSSAFYKKFGVLPKELMKNRKYYY